MDYRNDIIQDELNNIAPALAQLARVSVFTVPSAYFEQLPNHILKLVQADEEQLSTSFSTQNPYTIPNGYFDSLAGDILQKVAIQQVSADDVNCELEEVAPLLNTINKRMVYSVPNGYFDAQRFVPQQQNAKRRMSFGIVRGIYRYAAAAFIIGIIALGSYLFLHSNSSTGEINVANIKLELEKVSDSDIATYLDNNNFAVDVSSTNIFLNEELPIQEYIKNVSEEEIRNYLKENGTLNKEI